MKRQVINQQGFSLLIALVVVVVVAGLASGGWFVWNKSKENNAKRLNQVTQESQNKDKSKSMDETKNWTLVTTQSKAFSMKVPDGWSLTNYPNDFLGATSTVHTSGTPATIDTSDMEYTGHALRFRASVAQLDDAGLGPQWASPQPGLTESTQDFSIGSLQGKRYKGVFSYDLNQTLYEYVFDLGSDKKLDIVYTIYHNENEIGDVATVEKAIGTIRLTNK